MKIRTIINRFVNEKDMHVEWVDLRHGPTSTWPHNIKTGDNLLITRSLSFCFLLWWMFWNIKRTWLNHIPANQCDESISSSNPINWAQSTRFDDAWNTVGKAIHYRWSVKKKGLIRSSMKRNRVDRICSHSTCWISIREFHNQKNLRLDCHMSREIFV